MPAQDAYPFATPAGNVKELGRSWLPFSEGSKNCLGQSMALFTMRYVGGRMVMGRQTAQPGS